MLMVFKMVSPNVKVICVGAGRRCRDIQHDHDGCMAAGGHARAGALYLARAVNRGRKDASRVHAARILSILHSMGEGGKIWVGIYISGIQGGRMRSSLKLAKSAKGWLNCYDRVTVKTLISRRSSAASSDEKYTPNDRFQNRVYVFKASGVRSDEKIYIERLIRKSCL